MNEYALKKEAVTSHHKYVMLLKNKMLNNMRHFQVHFIQLISIGKLKILTIEDQKKM